MSTRCVIIRETDQPGQFAGITCQSDGSPYGVGKILMTSYATRESSRNLICMGDISSLGDSGGKIVGVDTRTGTFAEVADGYHDGHIYVFHTTEWDWYWNGMPLPEFFALDKDDRYRAISEAELEQGRLDQARLDWTDALEQTPDYDTVLQGLPEHLRPMWTKATSCLVNPDQEKLDAFRVTCYPAAAMAMLRAVASIHEGIGGSRG